MQPPCGRPVMMGWSSPRCHLRYAGAHPQRWLASPVMLTTNEIAARYKMTRVSASIRMATVYAIGGGYDAATVKRIMEPELDEPEEDIVGIRWLSDEVGLEGCRGRLKTSPLSWLPPSSLSG